MIKILKVFLVLDLVVVNGGVGYLLWRNITPELRSSPLSLRGETEVKTEYVDQCGEGCRSAIKAEISNIQYPISNPTPTIVKSKQAAKARREEMLMIPGEGSSSAMDWIDITATNFYFDTKDYPGLVEVYFEAKMKLVNGNGYGYTRLYDVTNGIAVNGSENNTNSQTEVWTKSQRVYFWAGKNLVRVQAKSLTADTVVYTQGRLRIVTD
ncbi:hypothetical protein HYW29_01860 [Candidatus Amesbacteria bacterium]|nr:hypothetical protein [Candidatus Amesbacteria bacterium]